MKIVHITDIHHKPNDNVRRYENLIAFLRGKSIDVVIISGDLCDRGGKGFNSIDEAFQSFRKEFLEPLILALDLSKDKVIMCPGNHDINQSALGPITWESIYSSGLQDYRVALAAINEISGRWSSFNEFLKSWYSGCLNVSIGQLVHCITISNDTESFAFLSTNSVWFSSDCSLSKGDIIFPVSEIESTCKSIPKEYNKVLVSHAKYQDAAPKQASEVDDCIFRSFSQVYSGHYHEPKPQSIRQHNGVVFSLQTRKFTEKYADSNSVKNANGFSILNISSDSTISAMGYRETINGEFCEDDDYFPKASSTYDISQNQNALAAKIMNYKSTILSSDREEFNRCLLTFTLQTSAPKNLDDLFVMPPITKRETTGKTGEYKEIAIDVEALSKYQGKHCLFGKKESGKTTLLQKIHMVAIERFGRISVIINFSDILGRGKLKQAIARKMSIKEKDVERMFEDDNFLLLIDDFDFTRYSDIPSGLSELANCKNQILMHACETTGIISSERLRVIDQYEYSHLFIEDFKSKQIRELCANWFSEDRTLARSKVEILVAAFLSMGLSCNPLSVSIFLWIMEKQNGKAPINKFSLIDQFVERVFLKNDQSEIQSSLFDYRNKTKVLAAISKKMLDEDRLGYTLKSSEVIGVIESYLTRNSMRFVASDIFHHFVSIGVLVQSYSETESCVVAKFRYSCLFSYYLMCEMGFDDRFLQEATSKDRYLQFVDEIELLSGKARDKEGLLIQLCDWMWEVYGPVCSEIERLEGSYDSQFIMGKQQFTENSMTQIRKNGKPSEEQMDAILDNQLSKLQEGQLIKSKSKDVSGVDRMARLWLVVARTLKNTEEVNSPETKSNTLAKVIKSSLAFSLYYRKQIEAFMKDHPNSDRKAQYSILSSFMPLVNQHVLKESLGTEKLNLLLRKKIDGDLRAIDSNGKRTISEFEWFTTVFLFSDLDGEGYKSAIKEFLEAAKNRVILDMSAFKLLGYY